MLVIRKKQIVIATMFAFLSIFTFMFTTAGNDKSANIKQKWCKMARKAWFYGKNIVLSGASSGIGFEMAKVFAVKYSCNVIGLGRTEEKLIKAKNLIEELIEIGKKPKKGNKGTFEYRLVDVCDESAWLNLKNDLDKINFNIDVLINNAGVFLTFNKFENQDLETCKKVMETNFYASLYSYKTFIGDLKNKNG